MDFLTAEWRKLIIANYLIDKKNLKKYLPPKTELDLWEGNCYVSLIGFLFQNTKLLGVKIPMHVDFEEVNLRFYVKYKDNNQWKRGVVFIKELVPKAALSFVANTLYKEHYQTVPMSHSWQDHDNRLEVEYSWKYNTIQQRLKVTAHKTPTAIPEKSKMEFITEHYWGYTKVSENKTFEYEVTHPRWLGYEVLDYEIIVDFDMVYGNDFAFMNTLAPASVMLAEGSLITVKNKRSI